MMQEKVVEILLHILNEVRKSKKSVGEIDLSSLERKGYTETEINTAFNWIVERQDMVTSASQPPTGEHPPSFRILNSIERIAIPTDAHGYLMELRELNIISDLELETIIERLLIIGFDQPDSSTVQAIVLAVLSEADNRNHPLGTVVIPTIDTVH